MTESTCSGDGSLAISSNGTDAQDAVDYIHASQCRQFEPHLYEQARDPCWRRVGKLFVGGNGTDTHHGRSGNETPMGSNGNDTLVGKGSREVLFGCADDDWISGGSKTGAFVYNGLFERDVVSDFFAGVDRLQLGPNQFTNFASVKAHAVHLGADLLATLKPVATITLSSVSLANWSAAGFMFI